MPAADASCGARLVGVRPGRVLNSRNQKRPSPSRIKSALARLFSPRALYAATAQVANSRSASGGIGAGESSTAAPGWYFSL